MDTKTKRRNTGVLKPLGVYFGKPTIELKVNGDRSDLSEVRGCAGAWRKRSRLVPVFPPTSSHHTADTATHVALNTAIQAHLIPLLPLAVLRPPRLLRRQAATVRVWLGGCRSPFRTRAQAKIVSTLRTCVRADEFRFGQYDRDAQVRTPSPPHRSSTLSRRMCGCGCRIAQATDYIAQLEAAGLKDAALKGELKHAHAAGGAGAGGEDE